MRMKHDCLSIYYISIDKTNCFCLLVPCLALNASHPKFSCSTIGIFTTLYKQLHINVMLFVLGAVWYWYSSCYIFKMWSTQTLLTN